MKKAKHTKLEDAIFVWLNQRNSGGVAINNRIITTKAKYFGSKLHITNFQYSFGCLSNFKKYFILDAIRFMEKLIK